jgi:hypothetical protein
LRVGGVVDEIIGTIFILYFNEELSLIRNCNAFVGNAVFDFLDPADSLVENVRTVEVCFRYDAEWAIATKIKLSFGVNMSRPMQRKVCRPGQIVSTRQILKETVHTQVVASE